jgi:hypothetical protein
MASHSDSRSKSVLGGKKSKSKSKSHAHSMHIHRGKSGGFVVTHHHEPDETGMTAPSEDHVVPDLDSLHQHMDASMGDQPPAPQAAPPEAAQAGPAAAAPAPQM